MKRIAFLLTAVVVLAHSHIAFGEVWYVAENAAGAGTGDSWTDAFTTIQAGITAATTAGDDVWVAGGVYREWITMANGVRLYGGLAGTEDPVIFDPETDRIIGAYPTIIDASTADAGGPAAHVVVMDTVANARIGGFTMTGAQKMSTTTDPVGGAIQCTSTNNTNTIAYCTIIGNWGMFGGGILCNDSDPTIANCTISGNVGGYGGGVCCIAADPLIVNCTITGNYAQGSGGGICCYTTSDPTLINTVLTDNGNYAVWEGDENSDPIVIYCLFYNNPEGDYWDEGTTPYNGASEINTLDEAGDNVSGDPLFQMGAAGTWTEDPSWDPVTNRTTLTDSAASFVPGLLVGSAVKPSTTSSPSPAPIPFEWFQMVITANTETTIEVVGDATFTANSDPYQVVDYHLAFPSAAIDYGTDSSAPGNDFDGDTRGFDGDGLGTGGTGDGSDYDIGADEFFDTDGDRLSDRFETGYDGNPWDYDPFDPVTNPTGTDLDFEKPDTDGDGFSDYTEIRAGTNPLDPATYPLLCVDENATGAGTGASWEDAFTTVQAALDVAVPGSQVWVAEGTYEESITLATGVFVYGDLAGTEDPITFDPETDRTIGAHPTIIDGSTADAGGPADHVVVMDSITDARIDGFTITGGSADGTKPHDDGSGFYCTNVDSTNTIANCTITGNKTRIWGSGGGGVYCFESDPTITNCTITGNLAYSGGGVFCGDSNPTIVNCTISGNEAERGGGVYCGGSNPTLINCTIDSNWASGSGGGVYCTVASPTITNTILRDNGNFAVWESGENSDPAVTYCLFHGNSDGDYWDEGTTALTGPAAINALDEASDNVDGDPLFQMGVSGTWTDEPSYVPATNRTILTDTGASLAPGALVGTIINPNTAQRFQALVTANTAMTIEVAGNVTYIVSDGDTYRIVDYHIPWDSPARDAGTSTGAPATDFDGDDRPFNALYDIGVDEFIDVNPPTAVCQDITVELDSAGIVTITGQQVDGGSTDDCEISSLTVDPDTFTCADLGENTVTLTVTDVGDHTDTCQATVTVEDNLPPTVVCQDITVELDPAGTATITAVDVDGGSTDNCGISSMTVEPDTFTCADRGENTVTLTVVDTSGNPATCQATVTVEDNILPVPVCQDITVELDAAGTAAITGADVDAGSTDNCGVASVTVDPDTFTCADLGKNTVTLTVEDTSGNISTCQATLTVEDNILPTAVCRDITVELDSAGTAAITGADIDGGSADNCEIRTMTAVPSTFTCADLGENTVTLIVADTSGNVATCQATVTVEDLLNVCLPGDVNRDSRVDALDVQLVINEALGIETGWDCDLNGDGFVDALDVQLVINIALGV